MSLAAYLQQRGVTNNGSEDYGTIASCNRKQVYKYFCVSPKRCDVLVEEKMVYNSKTKQIEPYKKYERKNKVIKKVSSDWLINCPDCGEDMFSTKTNSIKT